MEQPAFAFLIFARLYSFLMSLCTYIEDERAVYRGRFFGENHKDKRLALSHFAEFVFSHDDIFLPKHRVKWGKYLRKTEEDSNGN